MSEQMDGAQALIICLEKQGVEYIFGYSGGAAIPIFDAIETTKTKIKMILTRHEQGACHIADGYARASGKPGVVLVTSGPGAGNTITGLMTAQMDSVPMIVITGQQIRPMLGLDAFQEADIFNITMPVVKHNYLVMETNDIPKIVNQAFHIATSGRPGPVLIDMPKDVSSGPFTGNLEHEVDMHGFRPDALDPDDEQMADVLEMIENSSKPVFLIGHGVLISGASEQLKSVMQQLQIPATTTLLGKGAVDETSELSLGMVGMHGTAYANKAIIESDLIINIGSRFDDRIVGKTSEFGKNAKIIHVDIDVSEFEKMIKTDICVHTDAKKFLQYIIDTEETASHHDWVKHLKSYKQKYPLKYEKSVGLSMQEMIDEFYKQSGGNAICVTDVGQHQMWAAQFFKTKSPDTWLSSGGAGTMGYGMPAAIGAQFAKPNDTVIAIVGDGGFQMTLFELATAAIHKLPIKIVVMNNHYLGMVRQWQELFFDNRLSGVDLVGNPDFVMLAQSYGIKAINIDKRDEVSTKVKEALEYNEGPVLINCEVEKTSNVYPMIPAGRALEDMILKAPTTKLEKPTGST